MHFHTFWRVLFVVFLLVSVSLEVSAQSEQVSRRYNKAELMLMQGQSAHDLIMQIPGFKFVDSTEERGLSNAVGNVLVDGLPLLNKSQTLGRVLSDMPINQILIMEVYLTSHPFAAASQHTQVVNLIRDETEHKVNWRIKGVSQDNQPKLGNLSLLGTVQLQGWEHQLQLSKDASRWGSEINFSEYTLEGTPYSEAQEEYLEAMRTTQVGLVSGKRYSHGTVQINAQWQKSREYIGYQRYKTDLNEGAQNQELIHDITTNKARSLGVDWQQASEIVQKWQWHITGLIREDNSHGISDADGVSTFVQKRQLRERVLKLARQNTASAFSPEYGLEYSYNTLEANTRQNGEHNLAWARENRYEPFASIRLNFGSNWQLYGKLTAEFSSLTSYSDSHFEASNQYFKPLIRVTHQAQNGISSTFGLQRRIEQLNFDDFIPSLDNNFNRAQSGNSALAPEQSWEVSYEFNYSAQPTWALNARLFLQHQRDTHEFVELAEGAWGIGNAGTAKEYGLDVDLNIPAEALLEGSQFNLSYEYRDAQFDDPLIGHRVTSWLVPHTLELEFRKDADAYAWGMVANFGTRKLAFYPDEVYRETTRTTFDVYLEWSLNDTLKLNVELETLTDGKLRYDRDLYVLNRSGEFDSRYIGIERFKPLISMSLSGQF